jgi:anthranilate phosphoribosyltransferase
VILVVLIILAAVAYLYITGGEEKLREGVEEARKGLQELKEGTEERVAE